MKIDIDDKIVLLFSIWLTLNVLVWMGSSAIAIAKKENPPITYENCRALVVGMGDKIK